MTTTATPRERLRVMILPTYPHNPYQRLLGAALAEHGLDVSVVGTWPRRNPILGAWWAAGRPDVVHLHWIHDFLGGSRGRPTRRNVLWFDWQLRLLRLRGVRIVWTVHNLRGHEAGDDPHRDGLGVDAAPDGRDAQAHRRLIEQAHAVILHCVHARDALIELYQPSAAARARMHVVPHGSYVRQYAVDLDPAEARRELGLPADGRVIAFVGAIRGYKRVDQLLDAFLRQPAAGPADRLLICGKPLPKRLGRELEERAGGDPRVILRLDRIPERDLSTVLRAADVVALPFREILTSGSAILALSHGRPVVAPAMGCLPETLPPDATVLFDPSAPDGLREALGEALARDLASMGSRARAYADGLDWGPIAARTAEIYGSG
jgi:beta-1,4-mannosyltransferase